MKGKMSPCGLGDGRCAKSFITPGKGPCSFQERELSVDARFLPCRWFQRMWLIFMAGSLRNAPGCGKNFYNPFSTEAQFSSKHKFSLSSFQDKLSAKCIPQQANELARGQRLSKMSPLHFSWHVPKIMTSIHQDGPINHSFFLTTLSSQEQLSVQASVHFGQRGHASHAENCWRKIPKTHSRH